MQVNVVGHRGGVPPGDIDVRGEVAQGVFDVQLPRDSRNNQHARTTIVVDAARLGLITPELMSSEDILFSMSNSYS